MNPFWQRALTETRPVLCPTLYLILVLLYDGRRYFELLHANVVYSECVGRTRRIGIAVISQPHFEFD
jgi:hypothetical protein